MYQFVVVTWDLLSKLDPANALLCLFRRAFSVEKNILKRESTYNPSKLTRGLVEIEKHLARSVLTSEEPEFDNLVPQDLRAKAPQRAWCATCEMAMAINGPFSIA